MTVLVDGELVLYGFVGDSFWDDGFTASEVIDALAMLGRDADVTVRINSGGGYTDDGIAIFNALSAHRGTVNVVVDAIAASSASVIAMAGDTITMRSGALMMIHDPAGGTYGDAAAHEKTTDILNKLAGVMADIYAERTGDDVEDIRDEMKAELWMTGDEAVDRGFATATEKGKARAATAFDYRVYAQAPRKLVALAKKQKWSFEAVTRKAASAAKPEAHEKETPTMAAPPKAAETPTAAAPREPEQAPAGQADEAAIHARIEAIMEGDEGQANPPLAKHLAFRTRMSVEDAIATLKAAAADAPKAKAQADDPPDPARYQASRSAAADLAQPAPGTSAKPKASINTGGIYAARRAAKEA